MRTHRNSAGTRGHGRNWGAAGGSGDGRLPGCPSAPGSGCMGFGGRVRFLRGPRPVRNGGWGPPEAQAAEDSGDVARTSAQPLTLEHGRRLPWLWRRAWPALPPLRGHGPDGGSCSAMPGTRGQRVALGGQHAGAGPQQGAQPQLPRLCGHEPLPCRPPTRGRCSGGQTHSSASHPRHSGRHGVLTSALSMRPAPEGPAGAPSGGGSAAWCSRGKEMCFRPRVRERLALGCWRLHLAGSGQRGLRPSLGNAASRQWLCPQPLS